MAAYEIIRGDSYALRRPLFTYTLVNPDTLDPFDLTNCTMRTTWKVTALDPDTDPTDNVGVLKGTLIVDGTGTATTEDHLYLIGPAADGVVEHRVTAADTLALPTDVTWISDVEVVDENGEVFTFFFDDTMTARNGITNRTTG